MQKRNIKNLAELKAEIKRLQELSAVQEKIIREDVTDIRESLKPKNLLLDGLSSITGIKIDKNNFLTGGITAGLLLLFRKYISKAEANAEDSFYKMTDRLFERVRHFLSTFMNVRRHYPESKENEPEE